MAVETLEELDEMIAQEKARVTSEVLAEAWEELLGEGIEPSIVAEAAVHTLFERLASEAGQPKAEALIAEVVRRVDCGAYLPPTAIQ